MPINWEGQSYYNDSQLVSRMHSSRDSRMHSSRDCRVNDSQWPLQGEWAPIVHSSLQRVFEQSFKTELEESPLIY